MSDKKKTKPAPVETSFVKSELQKVASMQKQFNEKQLALVRDMVNPDLNDRELFVFLSFASKLELNPFLGEIIPIVYGRASKDRKVNYIVTRNGKRVVASRTGELTGIESEALFANEEGNECEMWNTGAKLVGAKATVRRRKHIYSVTVAFKEYDTGRNVWATKPMTMICKVAESQALSSAFPELLGATYDDSEAHSITNGKKEIEVPNGDAPATMNQIEAIKLMGKKIPDKLTKKQAVELLTSKKGETNGTTKSKPTS